MLADDDDGSMTVMGEETAMVDGGWSIEAEAEAVEMTVEREMLEVLRC